jgi:hypothetical protein
MPQMQLEPTRTETQDRQAVHEYLRQQEHRTTAQTEAERQENERREAQRLQALQIEEKRRLQVESWSQATMLTCRISGLYFKGSSMMLPPLYCLWRENKNLKDFNNS